ncbi:MAG TPA: alpha/beta fold hydrolase, partial [Aggregatilineales bacterium]|nr:alpha/beta fold hydrolase [Aggregatilineales bacterium]
VVVAPEHVETDTGDPKTTNFWDPTIDRLHDIKQVLDYAEKTTATGGDMAGLVDTKHVAVAGHSYGGYTALAMAGAQIDMDAYNAHCQSINGDDTAFNIFDCGMLMNHEADMAARAGLDPMPKGLWPSFGDERVTAIIPMATDASLFTQAGLAKITIPMMALGGTADTMAPFEWFAKPAYVSASSAQKALVAFENADHPIFLTPCKNLPWMTKLPASAYTFFCFENVWDKERALDLIDHFTTAFLLDVLKGDKDAHKALLTDAVKFPGVQYQTTMK